MGRLKTGYSVTKALISHSDKLHVLEATSRAITCLLYNRDSKPSPPKLINQLSHHISLFPPSAAQKILHSFLIAALRKLRRCTLPPSNHPTFSGTPLHVSCRTLPLTLFLSQPPFPKHDFIDSMVINVTSFLDSILDIFLYEALVISALGRTL